MCEGFSHFSVVVFASSYIGKLVTRNIRAYGMSECYDFHWNQMCTDIENASASKIMREKK